MAHLRRRLGLIAAVAMLAGGPASAGAQAAPNFTCETRSLIIGAAEMNGVRVHCSVSGAPAGDQMLRVVSDQPRPVCEVALADGNGDCAGSTFGSPDIGHLVAVLEPSGLQFDVLGQQLTDGEADPQLQYTPIPPDSDSAD